MTHLTPTERLLGRLREFRRLLSDQKMHLYRVGIILFATLGYVAILLFPLLLLTSIFSIYQEFFLRESIAWHSVSVWLVIAVMSGLVSHRLTQYKRPPFEGLRLAEDKAPELFNQIEQLESRFKRSVIDQVIITSNYQLDIVKIPRTAFPVATLNTLIIGLPVLHCLNATQFERLLARRLIQFFKRDNLVMLWLSQRRVVWQQYRLGYAAQKGFGTEPLAWFFSLYSPLYSSLSVQVARQSELNADFCAMEMYNDEQIREMITADAVCRHYLKIRYWPAVDKIAAMNTATTPTPHKKMAAAMNANFSGDKLAMFIEETFDAESAQDDPAPSLRDRIYNIGHDRPRMEQADAPAAATHYLGGCNENITALIDKLWLKTQLANRKRRQRDPAPTETLPLNSS